MKNSRIAIIGVTAVLAFGLVGWGVVAEADESMGVMTTARDAGIVVSDQVGAKSSVTIDLVRAPKDSFVVVHQFDGKMPGKRLGYAAVPKGVTRNVKVKLDREVALTPQLVAAVHVDGGVKGKLEFNMDDLERSTDRPYFVDGVEVAAPFKAADFGVPVKMDEALIEAGDQPLGKSVTIARVATPQSAFVVVHKADKDGMPAERVGYVAIPAGESRGVEVKLDEDLEGRTSLIAAVHADRGIEGKFEFDMEDLVGSPDQPYFSDGMEVAVAFDTGPFGVKTDEASLEATDQIGAEGSLVIDRVDAPEGAWVVVHKDAGGAPGERVGLARVKSGVGRNVKVELTSDLLTEKLFVALHADLGTEEKFDFDMRDKLGSADQPYFVDGDEVAIAVKVREFGYQTPAGTAAIEIADQEAMYGTLHVDRVVAPAGAWVVVHKDAGGMPGSRVGLVYVMPGQTLGTVVQLDASQSLSDRLFVALHADRGDAGMFEFDMMDKVNSPDQPFFIGADEVAAPVNIR